MVARPQEYPHAGIWPIHLRDPLPQIPVPLKSGDADAHLQLQEMLHKLYDSGGYEDYIYAGEPQPPLARAARDARLGDRQRLCKLMALPLKVTRTFI